MSDQAKKKKLALDGEEYEVDDSICEKFGIEGQLRAEIEDLEMKIIHERDPKKQAELRRQKRREIERHLDRLREGSLQNIGLKGTVSISHTNNGHPDGLIIHLDGPESVPSTIDEWDSNGNARRRS